jgi:hypothetical protein
MKKAMKKVLAAGALTLSALALCSPVSIASFREGGPCYGFGCPALSSSNKPYDAKVNKDDRSKDDTTAAKNNAAPAAGQQTNPPVNTKQ